MERDGRSHWQLDYQRRSVGRETGVVWRVAAVVGFLMYGVCGVVGCVLVAMVSLGVKDGTLWGWIGGVVAVEAGLLWVAMALVTRDRVE